MARFQGWVGGLGPHQKAVEHEGPPLPSATRLNRRIGGVVHGDPSHSTSGVSKSCRA